MDLHAYHRALNLGFSESEASRIGDDAWENNRHQPTCEPEPEPDYYDVLAAENTQLRAELAEAQTVKESLIVALDLFGRHSPKGKPCPVCEAIDAAMAGGEHENKIL